MFQAHVFVIRRSKLRYTASGIIKPIGGCLVHETATYRYDDARYCVMQFWPPNDEHMCSKNVEAWNKLIVKQKFCVSSWLITVKYCRNSQSEESWILLYYSLFQNIFSAWNGSDKKIVNHKLSKFGIPRRCVADCEKFTGYMTLTMKCCLDNRSCFH